jgi:DNA-binding transcriptional LysR family regulator
MKDIGLTGLKVVNAIIEHKKAQEAARVLGISPSSISYTLKKIRRETQADLFTRTQYGLKPDNYALELQKRYKEIQSLSENRREFIITTYSPVELLIGMHFQSLAQDSLSLQFQSMPDTTERRLKNLKHRSVDIDIGSQLPYDHAVVSCPYIMSGMCVMTSENHPSIKEMFTENDWYMNQHITWLRGNEDISDVIINMDNNRAIFEGRKIAFESTSLLAMAHLCAYSKNIMLLPEAFAPSLKKILPVKTFKLPWDIPLKFHCYIHYHREVGKNPNTERLIKLFDGLI